jgi:hypothetical protein
MLQGLPHTEHASRLPGHNPNTFRAFDFLISYGNARRRNATFFIKSELASECRGNQLEDCRFNAKGFLLSSQSATQTLAYDSWWLLFTRLNQHCGTRLLDLKSRYPANIF